MNINPLARDSPSPEHDFSIAPPYHPPTSTTPRPGSRSHGSMARGHADRTPRPSVRSIPTLNPPPDSSAAAGTGTQHTHRSSSTETGTLPIAGRGSGEIGAAVSSNNAPSALTRNTATVPSSAPSH